MFLLNRYIFFVIAFLTIISACSATANLITRDSVQAKTDKFDNQVTFLGITKTDVTSREYAIPARNHYFLRSFLYKDSGEITHQIYVSLKYRHDWRYYNNASLIGGSNPELLQIDREVVDCGSYTCVYEETVAVEIPTNYLKKNKEGFKVKLSADSGDEDIITISGRQIKRQLNSIENSEHLSLSAE
jgi:hypothetical protein